MGIAHRLHTADDADRIAVVGDGRVTGLGGHEELLARDGTYARLWRGRNGGTEASRVLIVCRLSEPYFTVDQ